MNEWSRRTRLDSSLFDRLGAVLDPTRGRILLLLERHELNVGELCAVLQAPQPTVSRHLKGLGDHGWVASRAEGTSRHYRFVDPDEPGQRELWRLLRSEIEDSAEAEQDVARARSVLAERRTRSEAFFAGAAGEWDALRAELFGARSDLLALPGLLDPRWRVGDLGCGTGVLSAALAPFVARVIAVDRSPEMLKAARGRLRDVANVELRRGELEALPIDGGALDAAVMALALSSVEDPPAALEEAVRVLRRPGRLLVVDMAEHGREDLRDRFGHAWQGFSETRLAGWMRKAGLSRVRVVRLPPDPDAKGPQLLVAAGEAAEEKVE